MKKLHLSILTVTTDLSEAIALDVAKLANAITIDAFGIKYVFGDPLSLCEGIVCKYKTVVTLIL